MPDDAFSLAAYPVHLGRGATASAQPRFGDDASWYTTYLDETADDGADGRLVLLHRFESSSQTWEVHPEGEELVLCTDGSMTVRQELDGEVREVTLAAGEGIINPRGTWHTIDVAEPATVLTVTPAMGTRVRPR